MLHHIYPRPWVDAQPMGGGVVQGLHLCNRLSDETALQLPWMCISYVESGTSQTPAASEFQYALAIQATFECQRTPLPNVTHFGLTPEFYDDASKRMQWQAFLSRSRLESGDPQFEHVMPILRGFLIPPTQAIAQQVDFKRQWLPGGPWRE